MPACPTCRSEVPADAAVCPKDGTPIIDVGAVTMPSTPPLLLSGSPATSSATAETLPASPPLYDALIGTTLAGRYLIGRKIGEGGMGAVYEATHTVIGKRVAVKVLLEKFHERSELVARLLQEARLASSIGHENIVDVTDFGTTDDGRSFVVMEFLGGESLAQLVMREAPLPVERALRIGRQVASALSAAHAKGILHRDVKPENVYLVRRGEADFVKVVDFGISKAMRPVDESGDDHRLTHTGMVLGTPLYMSPEQARGGEDLDHRVDIWALGVMLYECLTGEVPFRASNYLGIISQVLTHVPIPPSQLRPELAIADAVESVVMRAMAKDRDKRYQLMSELEQDLGRLLAGDQNVGAPLVAATQTAGSGVWRWGIAAAAVAAIVAGVAAAQSGRREPAPATRAAPAKVAPAPGKPSVAPSPSAVALPPALEKPRAASRKVAVKDRDSKASPAPDSKQKTRGIVDAEKAFSGAPSGK